MKKSNKFLIYSKIYSKRALKYTAMSFIICFGSAIGLRLVNTFLGINTPDFWWYFWPAFVASGVLTAIMIFANCDKIFKKPVKKKAPAKQTVRKRKTPAVATQEREYRRKVS